MGRKKISETETPQKRWDKKYGGDIHTNDE